MIAGLSGSLLSHDAMSGELENMCRGRISPHSRWFHRWHEQTTRQSGPSCSARQVYDRVAAPLATALGFHIVPTANWSGGSGRILATLQVDRRPVAALVVTTWGCDPAQVWREVVRHGIAHGLKWCVLLAGPVVRILDASHTYDRRFAQFDLEITINDPPSLSLFCALLSGDAFMGVEPALDYAVALSERHRAQVRSSLQQGVHDALTSLVHAFAAARRRRSHLDASSLFDESLVVIYRILFLLFAEARGLVPQWHPVFRDSYTIESIGKMSKSCRGHRACGKHSRRSRGSPIGDAVRDACVVPPSTAASSRRRTRRSPTSCPGRWRRAATRCSR